MKFPQLFAAAVLAAAVSLPASAQISVSIGQPGFYGRIDIGGYPPPPLIYAEPIVVRPARVAYPPLYLRVPPGHAKKWHRYCDRYNACGRPVYFVQDDWYRNEYIPLYREQHERREYRNDRNDRDDERGRGDRGHGHGRGRD